MDAGAPLQEAAARKVKDIAVIPTAGVRMRIAVQHRDAGLRSIDLSAVVVSATDASGRSYVAQPTNEPGVQEFTDLPPGDYHVSVNPSAAGELQVLQTPASFTVGALENRAAEQNYDIVLQTQSITIKSFGKATITQPHDSGHVKPTEVAASDSVRRQAGVHDGPTSAAEQPVDSAVTPPPPASVVVPPDAVPPAAAPVRTAPEPVKTTASLRARPAILPPGVARTPTPAFCPDHTRSVDTGAGAQAPCATRRRTLASNAVHLSGDTSIMKNGNVAPDAPRSWRRSAAPWLAALLVLAAACAGGTEPGVGAAAALEGTWHYTGVQTSGTRISYDGTVTIGEVHGSDFAGNFDAGSSTPEGNVIRVNGVVTGRVDGGVLDFDLQLTDDTRRHVGSLNAAGDTVTGTWANADVSSLGSFKMARLP
jgi:hypothetical protein